MAVRRFRAVPATEQRFGLAEGPLWDGDRNRVLWVDINAGEVHAGTLSGQHVTDDSVMQFPGTASAVVTSREGQMLVAGSRRLHTVSATGAVSDWVEIIPERTASRLNDGGCDPAGRFLIGSLALDGRVHKEVLVRVDEHGSSVVIDDDLGLSNGLGFTPAGDSMYTTDTVPGMIWIRDYDAGTGVIGPRREFLRIDNGKPDGMCVDREGNLWIAIWGAGEVRCYSPSAEQLGVVEVAAPNTSSAAFIGRALDTLLITTASEQLSDAQLAEYPDSGRLFLADVGTSGLPLPPWAGRA